MLQYKGPVHYPPKDRTGHLIVLSWTATGVVLGNLAYQSVFFLQVYAFITFDDTFAHCITVEHLTPMAGFALSKRMFVVSHNVACCRNDNMKSKSWGFVTLVSCNSSKKYNKTVKSNNNNERKHNTTMPFCLPFGHVQVLLISPIQ